MAGQDGCSPTGEEGGLPSKVIPHLQGDKNITLGETPELQVVIDSEARLVERTPQEKQGNDADDVNDDVTVPDHDEWGEEEEGGWVDLGQDATDCDEDGSKDVVLTNEEKEEKQEKEEEEEMETCGTNSSYYNKRVCRHMRLLESSLTCKICKLVRNILLYSGDCKSD